MSKITPVMKFTGPAAPRPSASLIVLDSKNRVLMVERSPNLKSFARAYVFPGGNCDYEDTSERMTAIRETFEETGLLFTSPAASIDEETLRVARKSIHARSLSFVTFLANNGLTADVYSLLPFTQWMTPPSVERRFHTNFFVAFLPSVSSTGFSPDQHWKREVPTSDGGLEVISIRFLTPQDAISEFQAKKIKLMPPQFYILTTLSSIVTGDKSTAAQRDTIARLAHGSFGGWKINPQVLPGKQEKGVMILTYEGDEVRGGRPGARHRVRILSDAGGMQAMDLERNINIFTDAPLNAQDISKL